MARYVEILLRYRLRSIAIFLLLPLATAAVAFAFTRTYSASAVLWVDGGTYIAGFGSVTPTGWNQWLTPAQNESDIVTQLIRTEGFVTPLHDRLEHSAVLSQQERQNVIETLDSRLLVFPSGSHLVTFMYTCDRPPICLITLDAVLAQVHEREAQLQKDQSKLGVDFLQQQLAAAQQRQNADEAALQSYLGQHPDLHVDVTQAGVALGIPDLDRLARQVTQDRQQVSSLQQSLAQDQFVGDASNQVVESISRVADRPRLARASRFGISGLNLKSLMLPLAGSLVVGLVYLFLVSWADKTARDEKEVTRRLQIPVLASIPRLTGEGNR